MTDLIQRLRDEADLCRAETADDIARLLDEAATAIAAHPQPKGTAQPAEMQARSKPTAESAWGGWERCDQWLFDFIGRNAEPDGRTGDRWWERRMLYTGPVQSPAPAPESVELARAAPAGMGQVLRDARRYLTDKRLIADETFGRQRRETDQDHSDRLSSAMQQNEDRRELIERLDTLLADLEPTVTDAQAQEYADAAAVEQPAVAPVPAPAVKAEPAAWTPLPFKTPLELWKAFKAGTKLVLHYYDKQHPVERMEARSAVVYVQPPGMAVKVFPDGSSAEGNKPGEGIWLRLADADSHVPVQGSGS